MNMIDPRNQGVCPDIHGQCPRSFSWPPKKEQRRSWGGRGVSAVLMICWPLMAQGQIAINLTLLSPKALRCEPVMATVTLRNNSGNTIPFDASPASARFRFEIETKHGKIINPLNEAPLLSGIEMTPGETRTLEFNIPRLYAVRSMGIYKLQAVVDWDGVSYVSPKVYLEVAAGFELRRIRTGVPDDKHATRTYVLEYLQKESEENLYLRIEDETANLIYGIFNLGRVVRVRMPDLQVDESGNIHVLFQTIGMTFIHTAFTPYGVPLFSESYAGGGKKIEMVRLPNGRISLVGSGMKKIPPGRDESSSSSENEPAPREKSAAGGLFNKP